MTVNCEHYLNLKKKIKNLWAVLECKRKKIENPKNYKRQQVAQLRFIQKMKKKNEIQNVIL